MTGGREDDLKGIKRQFLLLGLPYLSWFSLNDPTEGGGRQMTGLEWLHSLGDLLLGYGPAQRKQERQGGEGQGAEALGPEGQ